METHELRYVLATARLLNFTKAAASCSVSQPALTRAVKKLEAELGGPLFLRRPGQIELTRLGRDLLPKLEIIEQGLEDVRLQAQVIAQEQVSSLRLGVMCTVGPGHIVEILRKLRANFPECDVSIQDVKADAIFDLIVSDEIDVGITAQPAIPDSIAVQKLIDERYVVAMPADHALAACDRIELAQLEGVSYLERLNCEFDEHFTAMQDDWPFEFNVCYASEREDWIQALVAAGQGCAIVPDTMACIPGVVKRPLVDPEVRRTICIATLRGRPLGEAAKSFVRLVAAHRWGDRTK